MAGCLIVCAIQAQGLNAGRAFSGNTQRKSEMRFALWQTFFS